MQIEQVETFLTIAETGNFNKAAERRNVTQSTVSMRIKSLEAMLGCALFDRGKSGAVLTPAGVQFKRFAETMVRAWQQARQEVALPARFETVIRIGGQLTLWDRLIMRWIQWLKEALPDVAVRVEVGLSETLMHQLIEGLLDVSVVYTPQSRPGLVIEHLLDERLVLVSTDGRHRSPKDEGYVYVDWGPEFRLNHGNAFPDLETPALYVSHAAVGLRYILDNGGAGYFSRRLVQPYLAEGRLTVVQAPAFTCPAYVVYAAANDDVRFRAALDGLRRTAADEHEAEPAA